MAGPGGQEVGRISIRVVPDTERFRSSLRAQLEAIERENEVEVRVTPDARGAATQMAGIMTRLRAMAARGVRVPIEVANERLRNSALGRFAEDLRTFAQRTREGNRNLSDYEVRVRTLKEAFRRTVEQVDQLRGRFGSMERALARGRNSFRDFGSSIRDHNRYLRQAYPEADRLSLALRSLAAAGGHVGRAFQRWDLENSNRLMQRLRDNARRLPSAMGAGLGRVGRGIQNLDVRGSNAVMRGLRRALGGNADESIRLSTALERLRNGLSRVRGAVDKVTPSFTRMGNGSNQSRNRILLLSAAVLALASPLAGLVAGALTALPSLLFAGGAAAGAIALGLDGIKRAASTLAPELEKLKASVSKTFEERLTPQFEQLKALFPTLDVGMNQVANGLADMSQGFVNVLTSAQGMGQIQTILRNTGALFTAITPYVETLTSTLLNLGAIGSEHFDGLAASMNNWATNFKTTVDSLVASGDFDAMFAGLKNVSDGFGNLFNDVFAIGVRAMGQLGPELGNFLTTLGNVLETLEPGMTSFASSVLQVLQAFGTAVAPEFTEFLTNLGTILQQVEPILSSLVNNALRVLNSLMVSLGPAIEKAAPGFEKLFNALGTGLSEGLLAMGPAFEQLGAAFTQMMSNQEFLDALSDFFAQLGRSLAELLPKLVEIAPELIELTTTFLNLATDALPLVEGALQLVMTAFQGLIQWMNDTVEAVDTGVAFIKSAWESVTGFFSNAGSLLINAGKALMSGLLSGIKAGWEEVASFVSSIAGRIASLKGPIPYDKIVLIPNGEALMEGLDSGLQSGLEGVLETTKSIVGQLGDAMRGEQAGLVNAAKTLMASVREVFGDSAGMGIVIIIADFKEAVGEVTDIATESKQKIADKLGTSSVGSTSKSKSKSATESNIAKLDDETKKRLDLLKLQSDELDMEAKRLDMLADRETNKRRKQELKDRADDLRMQADQLDMQGKQLEYEKKYGEQADSIVNQMSSVAPQMETHGETIMQRLQRGLEHGWVGVQDELRKMGDDFGETFGVENFSDKFDEILDKSGFGTLPEDFAKATGQQFLSDLGIQGKGFIPQLFEQGVQYIFQVNSVDEAMQAKQTQQNKERLKYTRR